MEPQKEKTQRKRDKLCGSSKPIKKKNIAERKTELNEKTLHRNGLRKTIKEFERKSLNWNPKNKPIKNKNATQHCIKIIAV